MTRRLFPWRREPKEPLTPGRHRVDPPSPHPGRSCDRTCDITDAAHGYGGVFTAEVPLPPVSHVDTARTPTHLLEPPAVDTKHIGATEEFGDELAAMRERLDADVQHGVTALDPAEQARQREELAWEEAFARAEGAIDMEAARGRRVVTDALDKFLPGWADAICGLRHCALCAPTFEAAMEKAGVIALGAEAVDWGTAEYAVVPA